MTGDPEQLIWHSPDWWSAVGTLVNAAIVILLAVINYLYLRAANRQAKAAETQTREIKEQIALTCDQLDVMRDALQFSHAENRAERRRQLTIATGEIRKIVLTLKELRSRLAQSNPNYNLVSEGNIYPDTWNEVAHCIEREMDHGDHWAKVSQDCLLTTRSEFNSFKERLRSAMPPQTMVELKAALNGQVEQALEKLEMANANLEDKLELLRSGGSHEAADNPNK